MILHVALRGPCLNHDLPDLLITLMDRTSSIQYRVSRIPHPASSIQYPASSIQHPASALQISLPEFDHKILHIHWIIKRLTGGL
jgi:hypothetical protein